MLTFLAIIAVIGIYLVVAYNGLVRLKNEIDNAWRQIDVQLKRRHDLIPNLVEAVKGYMEFERDTLTQVVEARNRAVAAPNQASRVEAENQLTAGLGRLLAIIERYPQLKADQNVMQLQEQLSTTENQLAFSRQAYNDVVLNYNTRIQSFPTNMIATNFGFTSAEYFKIEEPDRAVPKVDLSLGLPHS
jgi:LemA protein